MARIIIQVFGCVAATLCRTRRLAEAPDPQEPDSERVAAGAPLRAAIDICPKWFVEYHGAQAELEAAKVPNGTTGEEHGLSVFFSIGDDVFHTYSAYARGTEALTDARALLDMTPYGRQQDFEDSPPGWPQKPTYG